MKTLTLLDSDPWKVGHQLLREVLSLNVHDINIPLAQLTAQSYDVYGIPR